MTAWFFGKLPVLCVAAALLELDATCIGQWMVSRPLVLGPLIGWLCGTTAVGVSVGILMEMMTLDDLPVGCAMPLNASIAAASAVLLAAGPFALEPAAAFPAGLALGGLFTRVEAWIRFGRSRLARRAEDSLESGRPLRIGKYVVLGWGCQAVSSAAFLYAAAVSAGPVIFWAWGGAPAFVRQGCGLAFVIAQCLGWATLLFALRPR